MLAWTYGPVKDSRISLSLFEEAPNKGRFPLIGTVISVSMGFFVILIILARSPMYAWYGMLGLWLANLFGWLLVRRKSLKTFEYHKKFYDESGMPISAYVIGKLENYVCGNWKFVRHTCLGVGLLLILLVYLKGDLLIDLFHLDTDTEFLFSVSFLLWVITSEGQMWSRRIEAVTHVNALIDYGVHHEKIESGYHEGQAETKE